MTEIDPNTILDFPESNSSSIDNLNPDIGPEIENVGTPSPKGKKMATREKGINKPTSFKEGQNLHPGMQDLHINTEDEDKIVFLLSFMNEKEALWWKQTFLRYITNDKGDMIFPSFKDFVQELLSYFQPANTTQEAAHQWNYSDKETRQQKYFSVIAFPTLPTTSLRNWLINDYFDILQTKRMEWATFTNSKSYFATGNALWKPMYWHFNKKAEKKSKNNNNACT